MKGTPQPIIYRGLHYPSQMALARAFGVDPRQINERLHGRRRIGRRPRPRMTPADDRLVWRRERPRQVPPPETATAPMYVVTYFGVWKV